MGGGFRSWHLQGGVALALSLGSGCATMRRVASDPDLRPCCDEFAVTADGWRLGIRHIRPPCPDPGKDPVVLCHGLGLNGTFWTITDGHLPGQLAARGYEVFVVDLRGSGASHRVGAVGWVNSALRQTFLLEVGEGRWTMDDQALYDVPAILEHICRTTGRGRVNWIGHSRGGMLLFAFLERSPAAGRVGAFVAMGSPAILAETPQQKMLRANRNLRLLLSGISTGRLARAMMVARPPGLDRVDRFYYTAENVDPRTISRFYGFTLEDPGRGALHQLDAYLEFGHLVSADGKVDYFEGLGAIRVPTLFVAGQGDILADMASKERTFAALGSADKAMLRLGLRHGHRADYGHCDLVWSRYAPREAFPPIIDWLDRHQGGSGDVPRVQEAVQADPGPGLEVGPLAP